MQIFGMKRTQRYKSLKREIIFKSLCILTFLIFIVYLYQHYDNDDNIYKGGARRILGNDDEGFKIPDASYPQDLLTKKQLESGGLILHVLGLFYTFLAIAIVCDEFFVPAIEVIVDSLNMSPDTAGATFMAAGGSAPELFTSFIGTFISKSDVGFGTIVGSAVFNVLFVIGCCAIFSSGDLVLTWYPFGRDCLYYCISLCTLAGFFYDKVIQWWEALILFLMYFGYVTLMINNAKLYGWIDRTIIKTPERKRATTAEAQLRPPQPIQTFSVSLFKLMTGDADIAEIAGIHMVSRIKGDVKQTFKQVDANGDGIIDKGELKAVLQRLGGEVSDEDVDKCYKQLDENDDGEIDEQEFSRWYLRSENRMETDIKQIFKSYDHDNNGYIEATELEELVAACQGNKPGSKPSDEDLNNAKKILDENNDGRISRDEFLNWYKTSVFFKKDKERRDTLMDIEEEEEGINLSFPTNPKGRILYIFNAPIMFSLYFTIPDVRKQKWRSWYPVAFIMSILWLGIFSFLMVWWATVIGKIIGIPDGIMGLTLLAAGTSVPDLLTSIIVAREGHGDMAVSSSIGSNIFDVLVGLPLPWLCACAAWGGSIEVQADSLFLSILILFAMLGAVLGIIYWSNWRMTRPLGYSMFVLYLIFVVQDVVRQYLA